MPADKSSGKPRKNSALKLVPGGVKGLQCDALGEQRCMMQRGERKPRTDSPDTPADGALLAGGAGGTTQLRVGGKDVVHLCAWRELRILIVLGLAHLAYVRGAAHPTAHCARHAHPAPLRRRSAEFSQGARQADPEQDQRHAASTRAAPHHDRRRRETGVAGGCRVSNRETYLNRQYTLCSVLCIITSKNVTRRPAPRRARPASAVAAARVPPARSRPGPPPQACGRAPLKNVKSHSPAAHAVRSLQLGYSRVRARLHDWSLSRTSGVPHSCVEDSTARTEQGPTKTDRTAEESPPPRADNRSRSSAAGTRRTQVQRPSALLQHAREGMGSRSCRKERAKPGGRAPRPHLGTPIARRTVSSSARAD